MKKIWFLLVICVVSLGCSERAVQKNILTGGDPALATDTDMQQLKKDVAEVNRKLDLLLKK